MADLKTLRVCLSSDLPSEADRDPDYIYFVYNTLMVFLGKTLYGENYAIVESMPDEPDIDMLYICMNDGMVKVYDDYGIHEIAEVESPEMINILRQAGTMFYFRSRVRYIDTQTRMLVLPFKNGQYNMAISVPKDLLYNEKTIIKFNPETEKFEIYGETYDDDPLDTKGFVGIDTDSVSMNVTDGRIEADVKISKSNDNLIRVLEDGLYVAVRNKVTREEFDSFKSYYDDFKTTIDQYMKVIAENIDELADLISEDAINAKIVAALEQVYPAIDEAIAEYDALAAKLEEGLAQSHSYSDRQISSARASIEALIQEVAINPWGGIADETETNPDTNVYMISGVEQNIVLKNISKSGDTADVNTANISGCNAAVKVMNSGTANVTQCTIASDAIGAHALYADSGSIINTTETNIHTYSTNSDVVRSNKGTMVIINGGSHIAEEEFSRIAYAIGTINLQDIVGTAVMSEAVVVDGDSSVTIGNSVITSSHTALEDDKDTYTGFLLFKSDLPESTSGTSQLSLSDSEINNLNPSSWLFTVENTDAVISVENCTINTNGGNSLLKVSGDNPVSAELNLTSQTVYGDIVGDSNSTIELNLSTASLVGAVNNAITASSVTVNLESGSIWNLTGDSYIMSITIDETSSINQGEYVLYVNGVPYTPPNTTPQEPENTEEP